MKQLVIGLVVVGVLGAGGAAWYFSSQEEGGLDAAGRALLQDVAAQREKDPVDSKACRDLLLELAKHPAKDEPAMRRGRAWLETLLGRETRAWDVLSPNMGVGSTPADMELASRLMERRFALTGNPEQALKGATFARNYYQATGDQGALFLAWQLAVRAENKERRDRLSKEVLEVMGNEPEGRLVKVLVDYPGLREEAPGALAELRKLEQDFTEPPPELDLALGLFEIQDTASLASCVQRADRVLKDQPSNLTARTIRGLAAVRLEDWELAKRFFDRLLAQYRGHPQTRLWQQMQQVAEAQLAGGGARDKDK